MQLNSSHSPYCPAAPPLELLLLLLLLLHTHLLHICLPGGSRRGGCWFKQHNRLLVMQSIRDLSSTVALLLHAHTCCSCTSRWKQALRLLEVMWTCGGELVPDIVSYNTVMKACGNAQQTDTAFQVGLLYGSPIALLAALDLPLSVPLASICLL
jgi:hypothetical protein